MLLNDIVVRIPEDELLDIRRNAAQLTATCPVNDNGERIDWFEMIVRDWWEQENTPPVGWFRWWDE